MDVASQTAWRNSPLSSACLSASTVETPTHSPMSCVHLLLGLPLPLLPSYVPSKNSFSNVLCRLMCFQLKKKAMISHCFPRGSKLLHKQNKGKFVNLTESHREHVGCVRMVVVHIKKKSCKIARFQGQRWPNCSDSVELLTLNWHIDTCFSVIRLSISSLGWLVLDTAFLKATTIREQE